MDLARKETGSGNHCRHLRQSWPDGGVKEKTSKKLKKKRKDSCRPKLLSEVDNRRKQSECFTLSPVLSCTVQKNKKIKKIGVSAV